MTDNLRERLQELLKLLYDDVYMEAAFEAIIAIQDRLDLLEAAARHQHGDE